MIWQGSGPCVPDRILIVVVAKLKLYGFRDGEGLIKNFGGEWAC